MANLRYRAVEKNEQEFIKKVEAKGYRVTDTHFGTSVLYFDKENCKSKEALKYINFNGYVSQMAENLIDRS